MTIQTENLVQLQKPNGLIIITDYPFTNDEQQKISDFIDKLIEEGAKGKPVQENRLSTNVPVLRVHKRF